MTDEQLGLFEAPRSEEKAEATAPAKKSGLTFRVDTRLGVFRYSEQLANHLLGAGLSRGRIRLAHDLVVLEQGLSPEESRALFMAVILGLEAQGEGSTFLPLPPKSDYIQKRLERLLPESLIAEDGRWQPARLVEALVGLIERDDLLILGRGEQWKPLLVEGGRLYHQRMSLHEGRLVEAIAERLQMPDMELEAPEVERALGELRENTPVVGDVEIRLNDEQEEAALKALKRPLTIITGGPGTGKTSIVVSILRLLVRLGVRPGSIALAAPTGKAANRMAESVQGQLLALKELAGADRQLLEELREPKTLHRLLGYSPGRDIFRHHPGNPLAESVVIVDEASMIDLFLMERLFRALSKGARLVLLGDADQLPSVDTGAVLRDLVPDEGDGSAPTAGFAVRLKQSYRMDPTRPAGRAIFLFAQAIRELGAKGELAVPEEMELSGGLPEGVRLWTPELVREHADLEPFIQWWFEQAILGGERRRLVSAFNAPYEIDGAGFVQGQSVERFRELFKHFGRSRVLTLTRVFSTGSEALNERFHREMGRLVSTRRGAGYRFHPGEPVMMTRNDYERDLFNGDQGIVVWCREVGGPEQAVKLMAVFERAGELRAYSLTELNKDLEHAFAMTVHKSQGSEFGRVALVLPTTAVGLLTKELLYTAVTRASQGVLVVGEAALLEEGARQKSQRFSAVAEKLAENF